jgi:alkylation response protein AidB-like acyl-CoA dehydrogenase
MGLAISHTMEIVLENVRVPASNRIGSEGEGFKVAMNALNGGRLTISAVALGVGRAALDVAVAHAKEREQFGKKIHEFQGVSFLLADMLTQLEASNLLLRRAAELRDSGLPFATEAAMLKSERSCDALTPRPLNTSKFARSFWIKTCRRTATDPTRKGSNLALAGHQRSS